MLDQNISIFQILDAKKRGLELSKEQITWFIQNLTLGNVHDYQATAFLMAANIQGMSKKETAYLTDAMLYSGKTLKFEDPKIIDKHSTGGIGDKTSFILAPIAAACGVKVPMIAGRGLGQTGGTIDKIESIPGFKTKLTLSEFERLLIDNGIVLMGQTEEIAPADRILYALRDVTATIDFIPFITASIMSKKLAEGANGIVMDIKCGSGAFMKKKTDAIKLAKSILDTATRFNRKSVALITDMGQPLGNFVGHSLEVIESIEVLKGRGPKDLVDLSLALAAHMIQLAGTEKSYKKALARATKSIEDGSALTCFKNFLHAQGGDSSYVDNYNLFKVAPNRTPILAAKKGFIKSYENDEIGFLCTHLGGGRKVKTDVIDMGVGFEFLKKVGDRVEKNEPIAIIYHNENQDKEVAHVLERMKGVVTISNAKVEKQPIIFETIHAKEAR